VQSDTITADLTAGVLSIIVRKAADRRVEVS
jgi:hypothetical protein